MGDIYPIPYWQVSLIIFSEVHCVIEDKHRYGNTSSIAMMSKD